jgi:predicted nucleotidyltransferase
VSEVLNILKEHKQELFKKYPIQTLALFGSYSRGDYNTESDVDIMVEFAVPVGIEFLDLCYDIETILNKEVDLVSKKGIKPAYYTFIEEDLQYV